MRVEQDVLTDDDRRILRELAQRLMPRLDEVIAEWTDAWVQAVPVADPAACYEFQYNRRQDKT